MTSTDVADVQTPPMDFRAPAPLYVVGIGASAGGLEAISVLLANLPEDAPAAYVIAQHLSPTHKSLLSQLISRQTSLPVVELSDDIVPQANTIYVTPPRSDVLYVDGLLRLVPPSIELAVPKPSVDRFFISLAEHAGNHAVGIILSGTGSDGAHGVQAIRGGDGLTVVQTERSAKYNGMPLSAIQTGSVDVIGSPEEIGRYMTHLSAKRGALAEIREELADAEPIREVLRLVMMRTRVNFLEYKQATVIRRIERRMSGLSLMTAEAYVAHCHENPAEIDALFRDLLISVTRFFRDPSEFERLTDLLATKVAAHRDSPIRVWVPGCATGEEAYSIAMILTDLLGGQHEATRRKLQVFATDIDETALSMARAARYSLGAISDVPKEYVEKYLTLDENGGSIKQELKRLVIFSNHNVFEDPPFVDLDLISCRNLMIYFERPLQERTLINFHYGLRPDGMLFMGAADDASQTSDLFTRFSADANILRCRPVDRAAYSGRRRGLPAASLPRRPYANIANERDARPESLVNPLFKAVVRSISPDGVLMTDELKIVSIFGNLDKYVSLNEDQTVQLDHSVFVDPLSHELRILTTMASKDDTPQNGSVRTLEDGSGTRVRLEIKPLAHPDMPERLFLATFHAEDDTDTAPEPTRTADPSDANTDYTRHLEEALQSTRQALALSVDQWEAANDALKSNNQELKANNEELRSINEEMETSNEELQSTNEELITVNEALQVVTDEVTAISEEQTAILGGIHTPLIITDRNLRVLKVSRTAADLFGGQIEAPNPHISQIAVPDGFPSLSKLCDAVIRDGKPVVETVCAGDISHTVRCTPYANMTGQLRGVMLMISPGQPTD